MTRQKRILDASMCPAGSRSRGLRRARNDACSTNRSLREKIEKKGEKKVDLECRVS